MSAGAAAATQRGVAATAPSGPGAGLVSRAGLQYGVEIDIDTLVSLFEEISPQAKAAAGEQMSVLTKYPQRHVKAALHAATFAMQDSAAMKLLFKTETWINQLDSTCALPRDPFRSPATQQRY